MEGEKNEADADAVGMSVEIERRDSIVVTRPARGFAIGRDIVRGLIRTIGPMAEKGTRGEADGIGAMQR